MKRLVILACSAILLLPIHRIKAQCTASTLVFASPALFSGTARAVGSVYKYTGVITGVDAYVRIVSVNNASVSNFDNEATGTGYVNSFQPLVVSRSTNTNPGWVKFKIDFISSSTGLPYSFGCMAMAVVDNDGNNTSYTERIATNNYSFYKTAMITGVSFTTDSFLNVIGTLTDYTGVDTINVQALAQVNYQNQSSITLKVGTYLSTGGVNVSRQHSMWFRNFASMSLVSLPIELLKFDAKTEDSRVKLNWSTASENDNAFFEVQHSRNGLDYTTIGRLPGAGNSNVTLHYNFTHAYAPKGINFYRLKQIDNYGQFQYSENVVAALYDNNIDRLSVDPNPATDALHLRLPEHNGLEYDLQILTHTGQAVYSAKVFRDEYTLEETVHLPAIKPGVYFVLLSNAMYRETEKLIIQ